MGDPIFIFFKMSIKGSIYWPYRKAIISTQGDYIPSAVERRSYNSFCVSEMVTADTWEYRQALEIFFRRRRYFETLGFICREQFFAGEEAGWGAQILEHPECNIVLFADIALLEHYFVKKRLLKNIFKS